MADVNTQTTNILDKKKTTSTLDTVGNVAMDSPNEDIKAPPSTIDEKYKAYEEGYNIGENFKQTLSGEIIGMMFGDPGGGLKYPDGTDRRDRCIYRNEYCYKVVYKEHEIPTHYIT